jgi:hypothetical protein
VAKHSQAMAFVPVAQVKRAKQTRRETGHILREWYFASLPEARLYQDAHGRVVAAAFMLPIDVPPKPRTTRNMLWRPENQNYANWKRCFVSGIEYALAGCGFPVRYDHVAQTYDRTVFSEVLAAEPKPSSRTLRAEAPLSTLGMIITRGRGDWDNRVKSVLDACNRLVYDDDRRTSGGDWRVHAPDEEGSRCLFTVFYVPVEARKGNGLRAYEENVQEAVAGLIPYRNKKRGADVPLVPLRPAGLFVAGEDDALDDEEDEA